MCVLQTVTFYSVHNLLVSTVAVNKAGDTPLSLECSRGDLEMVKALINKDVDPKSNSAVTLYVIIIIIIFLVKKLFAIQLLHSGKGSRMHLPVLI